MQLRPIHETCKPRICPTLYIADVGTEVVIQGFDADSAARGLRLSPGRCLIRVPVELLRDGLPKVEEELNCRKSAHVTEQRPADEDGVPGAWAPPTLTESGTEVLIQGIEVDHATSGVSLSPNERLIRVPIELLRYGLPELEATLP